MTDVSAGSQQSRRPDWAVVVIGVLLLVLAGLVAYEGWRVSARKVMYGLSPGTVPYFIAACLVILSIGTIVAGLRRAFPARDRDEIVPVLLIVGGLIVQLALLRFAGFSIATAFLFAATALAMGRGPLWMTIPIGLVLSLAIWVVFTQLLNLSLPAGPIEKAYLRAQGEIVRSMSGPANGAEPAPPLPDASSNGS